MVQRLAEVIANPKATASLFELLASDMFELSADDFVALSTCFDEAAGINRRRASILASGSLPRAICRTSRRSLPARVRVINSLSEQAACSPRRAL